MSGADVDCGAWQFDVSRDRIVSIAAVATDTVGVTFCWCITFAGVFQEPTFWPGPSTGDFKQLKGWYLLQSVVERDTQGAGRAHIFPKNVGIFFAHGL